MIFFVLVYIFVHTCIQKYPARTGKKVDSIQQEFKNSWESIEIVNDSDASVQRLEWRFHVGRDSGR